MACPGRPQAGVLRLGIASFIVGRVCNRLLSACSSFRGRPFLELLAKKGWRFSLFSIPVSLYALHFMSVATLSKQMLSALLVAPHVLA